MEELSDLFVGFTGGVIGETSAVAILIGAIYLVCKKVISLRRQIHFNARVLKVYKSIKGKSIPTEVMRKAKLSII